MDDLGDAVLHSGHWTFSKVPFKTSLIAGQSHEFEDISVRMFNSSLVYSGLELSGKSPLRIAQNPLHMFPRRRGSCELVADLFWRGLVDTPTSPQHVAKNRCNGIWETTHDTTDTTDFCPPTFCRLAADLSLCCRLVADLLRGNWCNGFWPYFCKTHNN